MSPTPCQHQVAVLSALRAHHLTTDLAAHLATCSRCSDTHSAAHLILAHAADIAAHAPLPPPAATIWQRAEREQRAHALRRATRAISVMRAAAMLYLVALVLWAFRTLPAHHQSAPARASLSPLLGASLPVEAAVALVLLSLLGALCLLTLGHRGSPLLQG